MRKFPKVTSETQVSFVNEAPGIAKSARPEKLKNRLKN
jgi:hypothetical protein